MHLDNIPNFIAISITDDECSLNATISSDNTWGSDDVSNFTFSIFDVKPSTCWKNIPLKLHGLLNTPHETTSLPINFHSLKAEGKTIRSTKSAKNKNWVIWRRLIFFKVGVIRGVNRGYSFHGEASSLVTVTVAAPAKTITAETSISHTQPRFLPM